MTSFVLILGLACSGADPVAPDCGSLDQADARDACLAERIAAQPASQADQVLSDAEVIQDPMLRGATVSRWVEGNASNLPIDKGRALCQLLVNADRAHCLRRLSTPHLQ